MRTWGYSAGIRAVKTMAQTCIAQIMVGTAMVLADVDWKYVLSATVLSGLLSLLTSIAGLPEVEEGYEEAETRDNIEAKED